MLEMLFIATEPFGTYGPGPVPVTEISWTKIYTAIVSDPLSVATISAAFLGFFVGTLFKFCLDLWLLSIRRKRVCRDLAAELHAEIYWLYVRILFDERSIERTINAAEGRSAVLENSWQWLRWQPPEPTVLESRIGKIGMLSKGVPNKLIYMKGQIAELRVALADAHSVWGVPQQPTPMHIYQSLAQSMTQVRTAIAVLNEPLARIAKINQHDWGQVETRLTQQLQSDTRVQAPGEQTGGQP